MRMVYRYAYKCGDQRSVKGRILSALLHMFGGIESEPDKEVQKIKVAIIGAGRVGVSLAEELLNNPEASYLPRCFIETNPEKVGREIQGLPIWSEDEATFSRLGEYEVQEIIFAIPSMDAKKKKKLYEYYKKAGYKLKVYDYPIVYTAGGKRHLREFDIDVILDHSLKDTYTVSVNLCVIPRDNTSEKLAETNIENALERSVNVLNSDTMRDQIMKASGSSRVKGNLSASVVADTNIIRMSASGTNAESAYKLLKGALQQYPELSDYFESGYVLQPLSSISANNVQKTEKATLRYSLLLILLVLAGGIGATVCLCIFTDKIHSMEQAKRLLDIPMIGSLDYVKKKSGQKALLISDQDTDHVYEEAVDRIVTSIRSEMSAEGYKTLMVGSIKENDGKSTVTANIALNLARRGKKVVLVDCDMRHPSLAKIFDATVDPKEQFSEYLLGKCELDQVLKQTEVQAHPMDCIWQKKAVAKPYRLLGSERFISLINQLKEQFDYVVMDTPPLELIRDAEIISETADAMLMVMRQDEVHAVAVNDTVDLLEENGVTVIGGVLNMTKGERDTSKDRDGYRKYYNENAKIENAGE